MKHFDISWHSAKDGPGVRVVLFLQGCNMRCGWCHSPHSQPGDNPAAQCFELSPAELFGKLYAELRLLKDIGGLTVSGGEPMLQYRELRALLLLCKEKGVHTAVETAGCVPPAYFDELNDNVDYWLFGLKQLDPQLSKEMHADINIIINNFERLAAKHPHKITVRTPVIHQYTADLQNIMKISVLMKKNGVKQIELLAYNPYTPHYYDVYGIPFDQQKYSAVRDDEAAQILNIFSSNGINVKYIE